MRTNGRRQYFYGYGGWTLIETDSINEAAAKAAVDMTVNFNQRVRVVEVEIFYPRDASYEHVYGYTFDKTIPPHRKSHRDGDCQVSVIHHLDIRQGRD